MHIISIPIAIAAGVALLALGIPIVVRVIRTRKRPQYSLARYFLMMIVAATLLFAGVRWLRIDRHLILARPWMRNQFAPETAPKQFIAATHYATLPTEHELMVLKYALHALPSRERLAAIKILCELRPADVLQILLEDIGEQRYPEVVATELRLIGLHRKPDTISIILKFLHDDSPEVRAAALDALGLIHQPFCNVPVGMNFFSSLSSTFQTATDPPIGLTPLVVFFHGKKDSTEWPHDFMLPFEPIAVSDEVRATIENAMLNGATSQEREAAARALVNWPPPKYQLRLMEWGVWVSDNGEMKLMQSVLDEIPEFVHRTGNPVTSMRDRVNQIMAITKPVIQLTANVPLAIDLEIQIKHGRPWFAFPLPDDFGLTAATHYALRKTNEPASGEFLGTLESPQIGSLQNTHEGYPWIFPAHRIQGPTSGSMGARGNKIVSMGLRWQSAIVSPQQLQWMVPPNPGPAKRFAWWTGLRTVPCCWVSNRGESEKFIYYDGPTLARAPIKVKHENNTLTFTHQQMFSTADDEDYSTERGETFEGLPVPESMRDKPRRGIFFSKERGEPQLLMTTVSDHDDTLLASNSKLCTAKECSSELKKMLLEQGMTDTEAQGLTTCWEQQFFQTLGTRFIYFLTPEEYSKMCPIMVRPVPTEMVRVGIVLTEF